MKLGIIVVVYNLPSDLFMLQIAAIRKYCQDDYTIEVFDNSTDKEKAEGIRYHSGQLGVKYCKTFASSKNGSESHAFAANFAYLQLKDSYDMMFFIDHDAIPVRDFSAAEILGGGHVAAGIGQGAQKKYLWPGCFFLNNNAIDKSLVDFSPNNQYRLDTGGNLYVLVEKYGEDNIVFFNEAYHQNPYFVSSRYSHFAAINNEMFYHLVNGSNWAGSERNEERVNTFINLIKDKTGL